MWLTQSGIGSAVLKRKGRTTGPAFIHAHMKTMCNDNIVIIPDSLSPASHQFWGHAHRRLYLAQTHSPAPILSSVFTRPRDSGASRTPPGKPGRDRKRVRGCWRVRLSPRDCGMALSSGQKARLISAWCIDPGMVTPPNPSRAPPARLIEFDKYSLGAVMSCSGNLATLF